jgi:hypothetical protein
MLRTRPVRRANTPSENPNAVKVKDSIVRRALVIQAEQFIRKAEEDPTMPGAQLSKKAEHTFLIGIDSIQTGTPG